MCLSLSLFVLIRIYVSNFPHMYICGYEDVEVTCWWILFRLTCGWCIQHTHGDVFLKVLLDCSFWFINAENACMCIYTCTRQVYDLSTCIYAGRILSTRTYKCVHNKYNLVYLSSVHNAVSVSFASLAGNDDKCDCCLWNWQLMRKFHMAPMWCAMLFGSKNVPTNPLPLPRRSLAFPTWEIHSVDKYVSNY